MVLSSAKPHSGSVEKMWKSRRKRARDILLQIVCCSAQKNIFSRCFLMGKGKSLWAKLSFMDAAGRFVSGYSAAHDCR